MAVRVAVGDPREITVKFPAVADGSVAVTVDSARTGLLDGPFVAESKGSGTYAFDLTSDQVEDVDVLRVQFTATVAGTERMLVEHVEVAGGYYFTVRDARTIGNISTTYTDAEIEQTRTAVEDQIELNLGTSFVSRFVVERPPSDGGPFVRLSSPYILDLVEVLEGDTEVTTDCWLDGRYLWRGEGSHQWAPGHRSIGVRYESGYGEYPPADLKDAAIEATKYKLNRSQGVGAPSNVVAIGTDVGTLRMASASLRQPFGVPEVDAIVLRYALELGAEL